MTKPTTEDPTAENGTDDRPRKKGKRQRRNFAQDLTALEGRVWMALKLLRKAIAEPNQPADRALVEVAVETLEGK